MDHIEEVRNLDQRRNGGIGMASQPANRDPLITELPDIDDAGFQLLRKNDKQIVSAPLILKLFLMLCLRMICLIVLQLEYMY